LLRVGVVFALEILSSDNRAECLKVHAIYAICRHPCGPFADEDGIWDIKQQSKENVPAHSRPSGSASVEETADIERRGVDAGAI
jgi:hypothetical protein